MFGAVLFAWGTVDRETDAGYLGTEPASATIVLDEPLDADELAAIAAEAQSRPGVIEAAARDQFTSDIEINGREAEYPMQVFVAAPGDPMRLATFEMNESSWPPAPDEIFVRRDSLGLLGLRVGDEVTVTPPSGDPMRLRVADTVYDPSLAPSPQDQRGYGYLSAGSLAASGAPVTMDQLKIQVAEPGQDEPTRNRDTVVAVAGEVGTWLQDDYGLTIREMQVPTPYAHPHQWQSDTALVSLLAGGAAALLLAAILVANMLNGLFTQQIPQIGIMKAIGARSGRLATHYLSMTLLVAAAATVLALPLSVLLGRAGSSWLLGMLGIEPTSLAAPPWAFAVIVALGVGLPPLMALVPLVRTSRTTVRAAIDHQGLGVQAQRGDRARRPAQPQPPPRPRRPHGAAQYRASTRPVHARHRSARQRRRGVRLGHVPQLRRRGRQRRATGPDDLGHRRPARHPSRRRRRHDTRRSDTRSHPG